jgi:PAS domain S-box-containing protein
MDRTTRRIGDLIEPVCALFALVIGALAVTGWLTGQPRLASMVDGLPPAKANAALAFVLLGAALLLRAGSHDRRRAAVGTGLAIVAGCIGLATFVEYATGVNLGIDELIVVDHSGVGPDPGRMATLVTVAISLTAGSIVLHGRAGSAGLLRWLLALGAFTSGYLSLLGFSFGALQLRTVFGFGPEIALPAALSVLALGLAGLACYHTPSPTSILLSSTPGARIARVVLVAGVVGLPAVGWFSRLGEDTGLFTREFGAAVMVATSGVVVAIVGVWAGTWADRFQQAEKLTLEQTSEMEGRYRGLLEAAPDAMVVVNGAGEIVLLNLQAEKQFGYVRDELVGQKVTTIIPEGFAERLIADDLRSTEAALAQVIGTGLELVALRKDGSEFPIEIMLSPLAGAEGILVTAAIRDISVRKAAEEELRESEANLLRKVEELNRSNEELGQFAYTASHDLQEPLRMVAGYTQLLAKRYKGKLDSDADEFIAFAVDGAIRMQRLIEDLLAYSRVGTRGTDLLDTSSEKALQEALVNLRGSIEESGALVTHDPLPAVLADETQLVQLFQNLVGNAIKYRRPGVPRVHITAARDGEKRWSFAVTDNGLGIDPQYFDRIFGLFQRLHKREEYAGTGIGLTICKKIVERHGGSISVESQPGQGSTFRFSLAGSETKP